MLRTLVYVILAQGTGGGTEMATWPTQLRFASQQEDTRAANDSAPGLMSADSSYDGPNGGIGRANPNAVTVRPLCLPTAK